jgi:hypothetical protein
MGMMGHMGGALGGAGGGDGADFIFRFGIGLLSLISYHIHMNSESRIWTWILT